MRVCVHVHVHACGVCVYVTHSHSLRFKIESHFSFSSIHHCYCHSPTKDCSQQGTSDKAHEDSTYTHTEAVTYVSRRREVVSSAVIIRHVNRLILYTTQDTSSVLRGILYHYYIIVVGCSGPWTEERNLRPQNQFYVMISSCEK